MQQYAARTPRDVEQDGAFAFMLICCRIVEYISGIF